MNAKETLKKLAEALNIATDQKEFEATVETVEEAKADPVEVAAEQPATEAQPEKIEAPVAEVEEAEEDPRVSELEGQIKELQEILKNALSSEPEVDPEPPMVEMPMVEMPSEEPKGLTHSPEKEVRQKGTKIGDKGGDMMSRVFQYINNN